MIVLGWYVGCLGVTIPLFFNIFMLYTAVYQFSMMVDNTSYRCCGIRYSFKSTIIQNKNLYLFFWKYSKKICIRNMLEYYLISLQLNGWRLHHVIMNLLWTREVCMIQGIGIHSMLCVICISCVDGRLIMMWCSFQLYY